MPLVLKDRVKETTTTTGTGTLTLAGAVAGFQSFSVIGNGNTTYYTITDGTNWEVGIGTYTSSGTTLSRDTILESSNAGSAVNFGAGTKEVFVTYPAERSVIGSSNPLALPDPGTNGNVLTSNGTIWTSAAPSGGASALTISNKTGAYTVVAGDLGTIINCTSGTFTVSLTAAATLGSGFNCWIWNTSSTDTDVITIDPNGSETIARLSTLVLRRGEGTEIVCDGTNWQVGAKQTMRLYAENYSTQAQPTASASNALAIGAAASASATSALAIGASTAASASSATAIGRNSGGTGSQAITGLGAMALGGSYASGADSFAAAVANNTSSYGATGDNAIAIGNLAKATASKSIAIGWTTVASGNGSFAVGGFGAGVGTSATQEGSVAIGDGANSVIAYKLALAARSWGVAGDAQTGVFTTKAATTGSTPTVMLSNTSAAGTTNQLILPNNSALSFHGTIIARQQAAGGSNYAAWEIKGALIRDANAASTVLGAHNINELSASSGASAWTVALSADTTNGGLAITVTGAAATNIRWVASVHTSEVTYA